MAVKGLKIAILAALGLVSQVADLGCPRSSCVILADSTEVATVQVILANGHATAAPHAVRIRVPDKVEPVNLPEIREIERAARIRRMVPPVRVEMTFTPDLLVPPRRDPSL